MNGRMIESVFLALVLFGIAACAEKPRVLWNDECPYSFGKTLEEGKLLHREISDHYRDFRLQLAWQGGKPCRDPNEKWSKEISLARKIVSGVLKARFIPAEMPNHKFLLLPSVPRSAGELPR